MRKENDRGTAIDRAVDLAGGTNRDLAEILKVSPQIVSRWRLRGYVPVRRAAQIEAHLCVPSRELVDPRILEIVGA